MKDKLEPNMYVRTEKNIFKIKKINDEFITIMNTQYVLHHSKFTGHYYFCDDDEVYTIGKTSPNIMDLIEEGDILKVNDFKDVDTIYEVEMFRNPYTNEKYLGIRNDLGSKPKRLYEIPLVNLSIVTHEQFERMQYNLESEVN